MSRLFHVNVNCSNLDQAHGFYVGALGLGEGVRTTPDAAQPGEAFGLEQARWDAWILVGASGFDGGAVDLLEWKDPLPTGAPPGSFAQQGFQRIGIAVSDLDAAVAAIPDAGGEVWSEISEHELAGGRTVRLVMANDPDGVAVELIEGDAPRVSFVSVCCADLQRSVAFYLAAGWREVASFTSETDDASHLRIDGALDMREVMLAAPGGGEVHLVLVGLSTPDLFRSTPRPANALGIWRMALLVPDLEVASHTLRAAGAAALSDPVEMSMGAGLPDLRFVCHVGPDGEVLELIEQPV